MSELEDIHNLADELFKARQLKKKYEDALKDINNNIKDIEEHKLSSLLDEKGISKINLNEYDISKTLVFRGGYTKHTDQEAFKFLYDTDNQGALKKHVIIDLDAFPETCFVLDDNDIGYAVEYSIHHATLSSILKELVEAGKFTSEDIEKYDVYVQPQVKIKKTGEQ